MELESISVDRESAAIKYKEALEAEKKSKAAYFTELKQVYRALAKGHKVIDLFATFKALQMNKDGEPKLAIAPVDAKTCTFRKMANGGGRFGRDKSAVGWRPTKDMVELPAGTFQPWEVRASPTNPNNRAWDTIVREYVTAPVPIIPAKYAEYVKPNASLFILWELEQWTFEPPVDPIILRRASPNLFIVLAKWNLTKLERAVMKGHL